MAARELKHRGLTDEPHADDLPQKEPSGALLALGLAAPLAGLGAGVVGAFFRLTLEEAGRPRHALIHGMCAWGAGGLALVMALAALAAAVAAWMVRRMPSAAGSGIPRVMAVLDGEAPPAPARVIPAKFVAGRSHQDTDGFRPSQAAQAWS